MTTDLETSTGITNPLVLLRAMIETGKVDTAALEKMMDLAERWQANQALQAFARSMNTCQQQMPLVLEDSENAHTRSRYASLEAVNRVCKPCYTQHGFSIQFAEGEAKIPEEIRIVADVVHAAGHERRYWIDLPRDGRGAKGGQTSMNELQGKGSTFSYGQRYLVKMIFNLTIAGEDNDGGQAGITDDQTVELNELIEECQMKGRTDVSMQSFWDWIFMQKGTKKRMNEMHPRDFPRAKEEMMTWLKKYSGGKKS